MKVRILVVSILMSLWTMAQGTLGEIAGLILDEDKLPLSGVYVITSRGEEVFRTASDDNGRYRLSAMTAGKYELLFIYSGDTLKRKYVAEVVPDGIASVPDVVFDNSFTVFVPPSIKLVQPGEETSTKLSRLEILQSAVNRDVSKLVTSGNSNILRTDDGDLAFRGARKGDYISLIDGVKFNGLQNMPASSLGYIKVYSGGIPAKYGDTTGGVIVMETVSYFDLLRDYQNR